MRDAGVHGLGCGLFLLYYIFFMAYSIFCIMAKSILWQRAVKTELWWVSDFQNHFSDLQLFKQCIFPMLCLSQLFKGFARLFLFPHFKRNNKPPHFKGPRLSEAYNRLLIKLQFFSSHNYYSTDPGHTNRFFDPASEFLSTH